LILFHTTDAADAILSEGFRDGTGSLVVEGEGMFISEKPLMDAHEGAAGDQLLQPRMHTTSQGGRGRECIGQLVEP
jgi:hypothetical protein